MADYERFVDQQVAGTSVELAVHELPKSVNALLRSAINNYTLTLVQHTLVDCDKGQPPKASNLPCGRRR
jgi:hypothetical protein